MNAALSNPVRHLDLARHNAAADHERARSSAAEPFWSPVVIRMATAGDRRSLERLAELDSTEPPTGATLIGVLGERPVAAVSLRDGRSIADPFIATCDVLELLRLRAGQLNRSSRVEPRHKLVRAGRR